MFKVKYILPFLNNLKEFYEIYIELSGYAGSPIELTGTDTALTIQCTSGDENKLEPILGTEALIGIWVTKDTPLSLDDLIATQDNEIRVTVYRDEDYSKFVFQGFIVVEDNSEPFLDRPYEINIRALDGLGLLKGVDLVDTTGLKFSGNFSVLSWIAQILYKTDQTLNLRVYFNIFETSFNQAVGALEQTFLNSITFSEGDSFNVNSSDPTVDIAATTADDCYTALEKIVRCFRCRLFQEEGVWNLVNLYEYLNPAGFSYKEYQLQAPVNGIVGIAAVGAGSNLDYTIALGKNELISPSLEDQTFYLKLATKWIKLSYTYDQSQNKVCNQDLSEGDRNSAYDEVISSSIIDGTIKPVLNLQTNGYDLYCYTSFEGQNNDSVTGGPYPSAPPTFKSFIRDSVDQLGYSIVRNMVIQSPPSGNTGYVRTNQFLIDTSDILQISFSWRRRNGISNDFGNVFVFLYGDDGTFWALNGILPANPAISWQQVGSDFRRPGFNTVPFLSTGVNTGVSNVWSSASFNQNATTAAPYAKAPVPGRVEILFPHVALNSVLETWIKDIQITILPYLNGSYLQLKGDYNYSSSDLNIKQTESDDVEISDSPKRYFKGALLKANGDLCSPQWNRTGHVDNLRFTQLMEYIMYDNLYRKIRKIEGTWAGLIYLPEDDNTQLRMNGFLGSYVLTDFTEPTKRFMMTSFQKDYTTGLCKNVYVETLKDQNDLFAIPDQFKFSYIFQ